MSWRGVFPSGPDRDEDLASAYALLSTASFNWSVLRIPIRCPDSVLDKFNLEASAPCIDKDDLLVLSLATAALGVLSGPMHPLAMIDTLTCITRLAGTPLSRPWRIAHPISALLVGFGLRAARLCLQRARELRGVEGAALRRLAGDWMQVLILQRLQSSVSSTLRGSYTRTSTVLSALDLLPSCPEQHAEFLAEEAAAYTLVAVEWMSEPGSVSDGAAPQDQNPTDLLLQEGFLHHIHMIDQLLRTMVRSNVVSKRAASCKHALADRARGGPIPLETIKA